MTADEYVVTRRLDRKHYGPTGYRTKSGVYNGPISKRLMELVDKMGVFAITGIPPGGRPWAEWRYYDALTDEFWGIRLAIEELFLAGMSTERDPRVDPQVGDKIYKISDTGHRSSRQVVKRYGINNNNDILYLNNQGKEKKCWISTWMEWARTAEVEA